MRLYRAIFEYRPTSHDAWQSNFEAKLFSASTFSNARAKAERWIYDHEPRYYRLESLELVYRDIVA